MKKLAVAYFVFWGMVLCSLNSSAYLDPSTMTYVIQAVAGVFIAGGAAVAIYWHKIKKYFRDRKRRKAMKAAKENSENEE
jgi:glycerol uptake facilitator-like aquaporin